MFVYMRINRKIYNIFHPVVGTILMLHRVVNDRSKITPNRDIEITPTFLEETILKYKQADYCFVSLDDAYDIISGKKKSKKKFICITFDDGYLDNFEIAYPILKKHNCPFVIYITNDFVEHKAFLWWYVLEDILLRHDKILLSNGTVYNTQSLTEKNNAFDEIHKVLRPLPPALLKKTFDELFRGYDFSTERKVKELSMNEKQMKVLSGDELCTIGSHTISHPALDNLCKDEQEQEMKQSKKKLEQITGKPVLHFAYPYGCYNRDSTEVAKECGFHTAVMAWGGNVRKGDDMFQLKRVILKESL